LGGNGAESELPQVSKTADSVLDMEPEDISELKPPVASGR